MSVANLKPPSDRTSRATWATRKARALRRPDSRALAAARSAGESNCCGCHSDALEGGGRLRGLSNRQKAAVTPNPILLIAFSDGRARWPAYVLEGAALPSQIDERKGNRAIKYKSATPTRARAQPHARSTRAQSQRAAPEAKGGAELFCLGVCASSSRLVASKYSSNVAE